MNEICPFPKEIASAPVLILGGTRRLLNTQTFVVISSFSTFVTCAALGPLLISLMNDLMLSSEPCASPETCTTNC